jgi:hypothetical protein
MNDIDALIGRATAPHEAAHGAAAIELLGPTSIVGEIAVHIGHPLMDGHACIDHGLSDDQLEQAHFASMLGQPMDPEVRGRIEGFCIALLAGDVYALMVIQRDRLYDDCHPMARPSWRPTRRAALRPGRPRPTPARRTSTRTASRSTPSCRGSRQRTSRHSPGGAGSTSERGCSSTPTGGSRSSPRH